MSLRFKNYKRSETRYDGFVFAVEIIITLILLGVIYYMIKY